MPAASTGMPTTVAPLASSRSSSGGKPGCSTATRSPTSTSTRVTSSRPSIAPSTTVSSSGVEGPVGAQHLGELGQDGRVEVAAGRRAAPRSEATARDRSGQQTRVGDAGRQVEPELAAAVERALVARRAGAAGGRRSSCPRRPSVRIVPARASSDHAALTVVGESPSSTATVRIGGSRSPAARAPSRTARLTALASPRAVGSSRRLPHLVQHFCNVAKALLCGTDPRSYRGSHEYAHFALDRRQDHRGDVRTHRPGLQPGHRPAERRGRPRRRVRDRRRGRMPPRPRSPSGAARRCPSAAACCSRSASCCTTTPTSWPRS